MLLSGSTRPDGQTARRPDGQTVRRSDGVGGIRTHERVSPLAVFKTAAFNHSATTPLRPYFARNADTTAWATLSARVAVVVSPDSRQASDIPPYMIAYSSRMETEG